MPEAQSHRHHLAQSARIHSPRALIEDVHGFNAKAAVVITDILGSMPCFWVFNVLAFISLPAVLTLVAPSLKDFFPAWLIKVSLISLVSWCAQTYVQLTALSVLQVSNNAQGRQQEHDTQTLLSDAETTRKHTTAIIDALDCNTEGGLKEVLDKTEDGLKEVLDAIKSERITIGAILTALQAQAEAEGR